MTTPDLGTLTNHLTFQIGYLEGLAQRLLLIRRILLITEKDASIDEAADDLMTRAMELRRVMGWLDED